MLWRFYIQTDWDIKTNKPDIIVKNSTLKTCLLIEVIIPVDMNMSDALLKITL